MQRRDPVVDARFKLFPTDSLALIHFVHRSWLSSGKRSEVTLFGSLPFADISTLTAVSWTLSCKGFHALSAAQLDPAVYSGIGYQGWKGWETENKNRDNADLRYTAYLEVIEIYFRYQPEVDAITPTSGLEVRTISD